MNKTAVNRNDSMVESISSVSWELILTTERTRFDKSPGAYFLKNEVGIISNLDISGACRAYSILSFIRITNRLRVSCTITRPTAALNSRMVIGTSCEESPEGITSLNNNLQTYGVNIVSNTTPRQAIKE